MKALPIRLRLTLWYFVMFAAAALMLSFTSWWMVRRAVDATIQQDLQERIDDIQVQLQQLSQVDINAAQAHFDEIYRYRDDGKWLEIKDQDGRWIYRSPRMVLADLPLPLPQQLPKATTISQFRQGPRFVRMVTVTVWVGARAYSVETGISMRKPRALLWDVGLGLLLLTPAVFLVAAVGGHFLGRKALSPVAAITRDARRITDRNLDARLPVSETNDELSQLSLTLNDMLARIDAGFRSVRHFTANASHELRTPLARIRTEAELALYRPRGAQEYREALEHVHQDSIDMSTLVENLLTIARAEVGSEALCLLPVDLVSLFDLVRKEWAPIAGRLLIQLDVEEIEKVGNQSPMVLGDRLSILRLMRILLDNACKFTAPGGRVAVTAAIREDSVLLVVEDSGIGIAPQHHERVFERFYRVNGDTGETRTGAGLGLSLAAWIAEQHKTRITLESALGQGSRFEIPLARAHDRVPQTSQTASAQKREGVA